jgi:hypothetical protein
MVFTHLPSNFLLLFVPLMPTMELAVAMLLIRHLLSQMDVPTPSRTPWLSLTLRKEPRLRAFCPWPATPARRSRLYLPERYSPRRHSVTILNSGRNENCLRRLNLCGFSQCEAPRGG